MTDSIYSQLKHFWSIEVTGNKPYSLLRALRIALGSRRKNFYFRYRLAYVLYRSKNKLARKLAKSINKRLMNKYALDIGLDANIGEGLTVAHFTGITITGHANIGRNFVIRQNTTLGIDNGETAFIEIGDNVEIGANSCVMARDHITIGHNVIIGAMSFVNADIPDNTVFITEKTSRSWLRVSDSR